MAVYHNDKIMISLFYQADPQRFRDSLGAVDRVEFFGRAVQVVIDGMFRQHHDLSDFSTRLAGSGPVQTVDLPLAQCFGNPQIEASYFR